MARDVIVSVVFVGGAWQGLIPKQIPVVFLVHVTMCSRNVKNFMLQSFGSECFLLVLSDDPVSTAGAIYNRPIVILGLYTTGK